MDKQEVFNKITSEHKWYVPHFTCAHASIIKKRFKDGKLSEQWIAKFFGLFGYIKTPEKWEKV